MNQNLKKRMESGGWKMAGAFARATRTLFFAIGYLLSSILCCRAQMPTNPAPLVGHDVRSASPASAALDPRLVTSSPTKMRTNAPPRPVVAVTNIVLTWAAYTDAWFCVQASTNLSDWYFKTNVPICRTEVTVPATQPCEFFRIKTCVNVWSNTP